MRLHNLQEISIEKITDCFNKAFENYFVPIKLSTEQLSSKLKSENISLEYSVGVTIDKELAGFVLIGIDNEKKIAYNAGTGVIPKYRGQQITEKMYPFVLSKLKEIGIKNHLLEVICENSKAIKIYESLGYFVLRKVNCYKGKVSEASHDNYKIESIELPDEAKVKSFWTHYPTYQNTMHCIKSNPEKHSAFGLFDKEKLIGYIIFDRNSFRIKQFGVDEAFRNEGLGHQLFYHVQQLAPEKEISIINIDEEDFEINDFLQNIGLKYLISQFEMKLITH